MKKMVSLLCWVLVLLSCKNEASKKVLTDKVKITPFAQSDTLKFTSGIQSIYEDSRGNLWFGSASEGASRYDGNNFSYFDAAHGLSDIKVLTIQEDNLGIIWLGGYQGVNSFDDNKITNHTQNEMAAYKSQWGNNKGDLWFGAGTKEGIYRYDGRSVGYLDLPLPENKNTNNTYAVTSFSYGENNTIWIGTYAGVFGYDGSSFTVINDETLGKDLEKNRLHIRSIFEDSKGRLWIGNNGIGVLLKEGDTIVNFSEVQHLIHPSSNRKGDHSKAGTLEHVFSITEDRYGNIWLGDRDTGVWKFDGQSMRNYGQKDGLTSKFPMSIYEDHHGKLWFGMADGKVFEYENERFIERF